MKIDIELADNPTVTSQEKGINWAARKVYEKPEVNAQRYEYAARIKQYCRVFNVARPCYEGPVALTVTFYFKTVNRLSWGKYKMSKPDCDNAVKLLQDTLGDLGFFAGGDQQVADLHVIKKWGSKARVIIELEEVNNEY
jgi:Holliday junction resolvase RusA-like endonuclease